MNKENILAQIKILEEMKRGVRYKDDWLLLDSKVQKLLIEIQNLS